MANKKKDLIEKLISQIVKCEYIIQNATIARKDLNQVRSERGFLSEIKELRMDDYERYRSYAGEKIKECEEDIKNIKAIKKDANHEIEVYEQRYNKREVDIEDKSWKMKSGYSFLETTIIDKPSAVNEVIDELINRSLNEVNIEEIQENQSESGLNFENAQEKQLKMKGNIEEVQDNEPERDLEGNYILPKEMRNSKIYADPSWGNMYDTENGLSLQTPIHKSAIKPSERVPMPDVSQSLEEIYNQENGENEQEPSPRPTPEQHAMVSLSDFYQSWKEITDKQYAEEDKEPSLKSAYVSNDNETMHVSTPKPGYK